MEYSPQGIPILDISPAINGHSGPQLTNLANHLATACESIGCFYIKNHGVNQETIENFSKDIRSFFAKPLEYKSKFQNIDKAWTGNGYYPFQTLNTYSYMGEKDKPNDQVETFNFGPSKCKYPTSPIMYPDYPATLKENVEKYYEALGEVSMTMMRVLSISANAPDPEYFYRKSCDGPHSLAANYYPSYAQPDRTPDSWQPTHVDAGPLAIIALDPKCPRSLRAKNARGEWVFADPIEGTFFINLGRPLQRWTNDKWIAPEHGVAWPENGVCTDRLSLAFFVAFHPDAVIECLPSCGKAKYEPITFKEHIEKPLDEFYLKHSG